MLILFYTWIVDGEGNDISPVGTEGKRTVNTRSLSFKVVTHYKLTHCSIFSPIGKQPDKTPRLAHLRPNDGNDRESFKCQQIAFAVCRLENYLAVPVQAATTGEKYRNPFN